MPMQYGTQLGIPSELPFKWSRAEDNLGIKEAKSEGVPK